MPKAILEFNLPEDRSEFKLACRGFELFMVLEGIKDSLRQHEKYGVEMVVCWRDIEEAVNSVDVNDIE